MNDPFRKIVFVQITRLQEQNRRVSGTTSRPVDKCDRLVKSHVFSSIRKFEIPVSKFYSSRSRSESREPQRNLVVGR